MKPNTALKDQTISRDEAQLYIWRDQSIYQKRYQKSASALTALAQYMNEAGLTGDEYTEFQELYEQCTGLEPATFANVWQDPSAFAWTIYTYDNIGLIRLLEKRSASGDADAASDLVKVHTLLREQMQYFKAFMLGFALTGKHDIGFTTPFSIDLPFPIPGTNLILEGDGIVDILGIQNERLMISSPQGEKALTPGDNAGINLRDLPLVTYKGCHFQLNPWVGRVPGNVHPEIDYAYQYPVRADDEHIQVIQKTIDLIEQYSPEALEEFRNWVRCIAIKETNPDGTGGVGSASFTFLPGVIHLKMYMSPVWLAETFIHECYHNRLFFLDEDTHILKTIPGPEIYYSPWRNDPRPPHGILHAVTVFLPTARLLLNMVASGDLSGDDLNYATSFVVRQFYRFRIGVDVLETHAEFTAEGKQLFSAVKDSVEQFEQEVIQANIPLDGPAFILDKANGKLVPVTSKVTGEALSTVGLLHEHIELYDQNNFVAHWKEFLQKKL